MIHLRPHPRQRLYTSLAGYLGVVGDVVGGRATSGADVARFEQAVAAFAGSPHAAAVPMARTGLYLAVKAIIRPGQRVILSPYTISDVVNMVICAGGRPVFADIRRETCNIDFDEVARLIDGGTGAVLATHFYGLGCDIEPLAALCRERGVALIEDAAQAFGTRIAGRSVGTFGDAGVFSFGLYKNVNSFFGGMVITRHAHLRQAVADALAPLPFEGLVRFGAKVATGAVTDLATLPLIFQTLTFRLFRYAYLHQTKALEGRMAFDRNPTLMRAIPAHYLRRLTPMQARLALAQLARVASDTAARIRAAGLYDAGLHDIGELLLPPLRTDGSHGYTYYPVQFADRRALIAYALRRGRDLAESHHRNCADMACFAEFARDCPHARATAESLIYLPTYPRYAEVEIRRNVEVIRRFFGKRS
ncbi:MAG: DegT/DnrJ/EryC1/StrS aminotransferase family protein [Alphaproteobacteria bacterium]|nr:DegT/DnrJ/EryC1/StrS aminotransferase family protein [Alphaproteobacteria bacterium]